MAQVNVKSSRPNNKTVKHPNEQNINTTLGFGEITSLGYVEMQGKTKAEGFIGSLIRTATMPVPTFGQISYKTYARYIPTTDIFRNNENLKAELPITTQFGTFIPTDQPKCKVNWLSYLIITYFCKINVFGTTQTIKRPTTDQNIDVTNIITIDTSGSAIWNNARQLLAEDISLKLENNIVSMNTENFNPLSDKMLSEEYRDLRITVQNCDFCIIRAQNDYIRRTEVPGSEEGKTNFLSGINAYIYCFRLTKRGKTLKRILETLGWKYSLRNEEWMNILPLMAFYKGYFELFQPKNTTTSANVYTNTNCFKLSDYICEHDIKNVITTTQNESEGSGETITEWSNYSELFIGLLNEISESYYYNKPNLITAHISTPSIGTQTQTIGTNSPTSLTKINTIEQTTNGQPTANPYPITAPSLKLLMKMYVLSNKQSVIGGNIRKLIQSLYGYDPDTIDGIVYDCGRNSYDLEISMIPSQSDTRTETGGAQLGEIGGLAMGKSSKDNNGGLKWSCKADTDGYLMFYAVMVPNCQFFQGTDPRLKHGTNGKYSLYMEDFDSIGFEISTKSILLAERLVEIPSINIQGGTGTIPGIVGNDTRTENIAYGFIPQKMDYKILAGDIVTGDLRRLPYREQLRPYYLGKEISEASIYAEEYESGKYNVRLTNQTSTPIATPELRSVGKYNWLENFNKIFYAKDGIEKQVFNHIRVNPFEEVFGYDDPFIIHNTNKYNKWDKMKPTSESFETDGEENNTIETEHA